MLRVALIWPYGYNPGSGMPLSLAYLKSNLGLAAQTCDVRFFDCALHNIRPEDEALQVFLSDFKPHIVGVTAWARESVYALDILKRAKQLDPAVTTLIGGYHATCYADKIMDSCGEVDFLFRGEGERAFPQFLEQFQCSSPDYAGIKGLVFRNSSGECITNEMEYINDLDSIAWPDYDAMDIEGYFKFGYRNMSYHRRNIPLIATRGCPYRCEFCSAPLSIGKRIRKHSVDYLKEQIRHLYYDRNIRWFNFIDDNFTNDVEFAKQLCREIINMNLKGAGFGTPSGVRMKKDAGELWQLMKRAGWKFLVIAPESGSQSVLDSMKKDVKIDTVPGIISDIQKAGLRVMGFMMVGYPGETTKDLEQTVTFIKKSGIDFVSMHNFQPIPGTPVYDELVARGEIEEGILPQKYGHGERPYTPRELQSVNFQLLFVKIYLHFLLFRPTMFVTLVRGANLYHIFRSFIQNIIVGTARTLKRVFQKPAASQ